DPVITDFGLAKVVEGDAAGPTRTGQIMGTPAYMPPEQAEGDAGRVDARADVYALGATLYHMLTGEPPFKGASAMHVIHKVLLREPAPPSRLRPHLNRDLETICLRCLEKEPGQRYPSADALGDDLQRYLRNEPVEARRAGPFERVAKWARRNRPIVRIAAVAAFALLAVGGGAIAWVADTRATARAEKAERARTRDLEAQRRVDEIHHWFGEAERGALSHSEALQTAVAGILRKKDNRTALLLASRLEAISYALAKATHDALLSVEQPTPDEARVGALPIAGLRAALVLRERAPAEFELPPDAIEALQAASRRLVAREGRPRATTVFPNRPVITARMVLARRQLSALGTGQLDLAELICSALGNFGPNEKIMTVLINYLAVVEDEQRAITAGVALCTQPAPQALEVVVAALVRFGSNGSFGVHIRDALAKLSEDKRAHSPLRAPTAKGYFRRANARVVLGDPRGAIADVERGLAIAPKDPLLLSLRGNAREDQEDLRGARNDYDAAIAADARCVPALYNRARLRNSTGDLEGARADYDRANEVEPNNVTTLTNRSLVRLAQGDAKGALEDAELALANSPGFPFALNARGRAYREQGNPEAALADFLKAVELDPDFVAAWIRLAEVHGEQLSWVESLAAANRALALDLTSHAALARRADAKRELGDMSGAVADLDAALKLAPNRKAYLSRRADCRSLT
ncbi:MAG: tetratricopeptide repeat protein, partial [Planctomycetota bacterium]